MGPIKEGADLFFCARKWGWGTVFLIENIGRGYKIYQCRHFGLWIKYALIQQKHNNHNPASHLHLAHTHTHTHAHTFTHKHKHTYTHTHARARTHIHTNTYMHVHYMHTHTHTHTHKCRHSQLHNYTLLPVYNVM